MQGIDPLCAMVRLAEFQERYDVFASRRKILDSVSIRFSIPCKAFPELDKTGEVRTIRNIDILCGTVVDFMKKNSHLNFLQTLRNSWK